MIILDTNVISEVLRPQPNERVLAWLAEQEPASVYTTAINQAEVLHGIEDMDDGRKKRGLAEAVEPIFAQDFAGRVLAFDELCARGYAQLVVARDRAGRPISQMDAQIAAIALRHRARLATRNTSDFEDLGLKLVNPWA